MSLGVGESAQGFREELKAPKWSNHNIVTSLPYTITTNDYYCLIKQTSPGAGTITLPAGCKGQRIRVQDGLGDAQTNVITISGTFPWGSSDSIATNYGMREYEWDADVAAWVPIGKLDAPGAPAGGAGVKTITADYQVLPGDSVLYVDSTSPVVVTLEASAGLTAGRHVEVVQLAASNVTVKGSGSDVINGNPDTTLSAPYTRKTFRWVAAFGAVSAGWVS